MLRKIRYKKNAEATDIDGYINVFNYPLKEQINGAIEEIIVEEISNWHITNLNVFLNDCKNQLSIEDGKLIIFGTNVRKVLKDFNSYNIDIKRLNEVLYGTDACSAYTIDYMENRLLEHGFKIMRKSFPNENSFMIIGVKNV